MKSIPYTKLEKWSWASGNFAVWFIITTFTVWTFSFYFIAIGLPVFYIMYAFIIWAIWNAVNDPLIGHLSDRIRTRWGRRYPFIMFGTIPLLIIEVLLWIPPTINHFIIFIYLLIMLFCFDMFYTMLEVPFDSLFPELFISVEERNEVNTLRQIFSLIGILFAFILPGMLIEDLSNKEGYLINGIITAIIVLISIIIMLKWAPKEKEEFKLDHKHEMNFFQEIKYTFKNRSFVFFTIMFVLHEYILQLLATITPLYVAYVLGMNDTFLISIFFLVYFISATISIVIWMKLDIKIGSKKTFAIAIIFFFLMTIPFLFITSYMVALIFSALMGVGFGGMLYTVWLLIADVIDDDELKTGVRREGIFMGITDFFIRFSIILSIVSISLVYTTVGWETYTPNPGADVIFGNRILFVVFPGIALGITLICLYFYPLSKKKVEENKIRMAELHKQKIERVRTQLK